MKMLTNEQLAAIEKLSATVVETRSQLAEGLCEALGEGYTWSNGYVNGHGNSIVLHYENTSIQIGTYRFKDPKSVSVKYLMYGDYVYDFDKYGKVIRGAKRVKVPYENGNEHGFRIVYETII